MATKPRKIAKRPAKRGNGKPPSMRAQIQQMERQLKELRDENRQLKKSLGALICKDDPVQMDLTPEDGVAEPSLIDLVGELKRTGK